MRNTKSFILNTIRHHPSDDPWWSVAVVLSYCREEGEGICTSPQTVRKYLMELVRDGALICDQSREPWRWRATVDQLSEASRQRGEIMAHVRAGDPIESLSVLVNASREDVLYTLRKLLFEAERRAALLQRDGAAP